MSIAVVCSNCSARLNAPDGAAGKKVKCPKCQTAIVVPEAVSSPFEVVEEELPPTKLPAAKPKKVQAVVEEEDEEDRPRKKKRRKGRDEEGGVSTTRNIVMGVVLIILVAVAAYIFYQRSKEKEGDAKASPKATPGTPESTGLTLGDEEKVASIGRIVNGWALPVRSSTEALNRITDKESALNAAKQLEQNAETVRNLARI